MALPSPSFAALDQALEASLQAEGPAVEARLALQIGDDHYLMDPQHLAEVVQVPPISRLGRMPGAVVGVAAFRGVPRTLIDGALLLGHGPQTDLTGTWATVLQSDDLDVALLWPDVLGLFPISGYVPDPTPSRRPLVRQTWLDGQGQAWHELDTPAILAQLRRAPTKEPA